MLPFSFFRWDRKHNLWLPQAANTEKVGVCRGYTGENWSANCHSIIFSSPVYACHIHAVHTSPSNVAHDACFTFPACSISTSVYSPPLQNKVFLRGKKMDCPHWPLLQVSSRDTIKVKPELWKLTTMHTQAHTSAPDDPIFAPPKKERKKVKNIKKTK